MSFAGLPASWIERARETPIEQIIEAHGIKLRGRVERVGPCPVCGGTDRFAVNTRRRVFNCRGCGAGGDAIALTQFLDGCDFRTAIETLSGEQPPTKRAKTIVKPELERDLASVRRTQEEIVPLIWTPGEAYLRDARKINVAALKDVLSRTDAIGWHRGVYFNEPGHALHQQKLGCIVGVMTDVKTAEPTGAISRTYLALNLTKIGKAKTLGRPTGTIRLSGDDEVLEGLFLAEGLETALAAMSIGLRPIWATGSSGLMASFPVLSGIEALNVIVDNDHNGAGEKAAREVEARWLGAGREVNLLRPGAPEDLNDALKGRIR